MTDSPTSRVTSYRVTLQDLQTLAEKCFEAGQQSGWLDDRFCGPGHDAILKEWLADLERRFPGAKK